MATKLVSLLCFFDGVLEDGDNMPIYSGGKRRLRSVSRGITYEELLVKMYEVSMTTPKQSDIRLKYSYPLREQSFIIDIYNDQDINEMFIGLPSECQYIFIYIIKSPIDVQTINLGTHEMGSREVPDVTLVSLHQSRNDGPSCTEREARFAPHSPSTTPESPSSTLRTTNQNDGPSHAECEARFAPNSVLITPESSSTLREREMVQRFATSDTPVQSRTTNIDMVSTSSLIHRNEYDTSTHTPSGQDSLINGNSVSPFRAFEGNEVEGSNEHKNGDSKDYPSGDNITGIQDDLMVGEEDVEIDLDNHSQGDISLSVGKFFASKDIFHNVLREFAIRSNFEFKPLRTSPQIITARCVSESCPWRIHASKLPGVPSFKIKTYTAEHTCVRATIGRGHRQSTISWVANFIKDHLKKHSECTPSQIITKLQTQTGVTISYSKAWKAKKKAMVDIWGGEDSSYSAELEKVDPKVVTVLRSRLPPGRPRKNRIPGVGEKKSHVQCHNCKRFGHNRRTCKYPPK